MARPYLPAPMDWVVTTLEPDVTQGYILSVDSGGTPSTSVEEYWDGGIPWLTPKEVTGLTEGVFVSTTERTISASGLSNSAAKILPPGTVMLTKRAPVGAVAVNTIPMATNQGFLSFACGPRLRPLFLAYWLKVNLPYLQAVANGSTYLELYKGDLFEFEIAIPSLDEQDRILAVINSFQYVISLGTAQGQFVEDLEELSVIQEQTRELIRIRDLLLPQLFAGRMRVSSLVVPRQAKLPF